MMPRSIDDQPGPLPGEGEPETPRAVQYIMDGYPGHVLGWVDVEPPIVRVTPVAWQTICQTAADEGELKDFSACSRKAGAVALRAVVGVGDDLNEVTVVCTFAADGDERKVIEVSL